MGKTFSDLGYDFFMIDYRGHKNSEGQKAYLKDVSDVVDDSRKFMKLVVDEKYSPAQGFEKTPPIYLIGHSFGGPLLLNLLMNFGT